MIYIDTPECKQFISWYEEAKPGDKYIYYNGELSTDGRAWYIKRLVFDYALEGKVILLQKRIKEKNFNYFVIKKVHQGIDTTTPLGDHEDRRCKLTSSKVKQYKAPPIVLQKRLVLQRRQPIALTELGITWQKPKNRQQQ